MPKSTFYPRVFALVVAAVLGYALLLIFEPFVGAMSWAAFLAFLLFPLNERMRHRLRGPGIESGAAGQSAPGPTVGRILLAHEGKTILERDLKPGRLVIGRTPDNDLQIDSKFISRHHCQITVQGDSCIIEDLNSTNGIYIHSKRMRRHSLNDGDVVQIGRHEIMYLDERLQRLRPAADLTDTEVIENP